MKEEIEKRRAEAAEKKKQKEDDTRKPAFTISPKGSSKVKSFGPEVQTSCRCSTGFPSLPLASELCSNYDCDAFSCWIIFGGMLRKKKKKT